MLPVLHVDLVRYSQRLSEAATHIAEEESCFEKLNNLFKLPELRSDRAKSQTQTAWFQNVCSREGPKSLHPHNGLSSQHPDPTFPGLQPTSFQFCPHSYWQSISPQWILPPGSPHHFHIPHISTEEESDAGSQNSLRLMTWSKGTVNPSQTAFLCSLLSHYSFWLLKFSSLNSVKWAA